MTATSNRQYRLGIDVGGTNTDAVILDDELRVIGSVKSPTTENSGDGIATAIDEVLARTGVIPESIGHVMLGTTHCTNAIVQRRGLSRVGVLRIGGPATTAVPPLEGWPADLRDAIGAHDVIVRGGYEVDGRMIAPLDEQEVRAACERMAGEVDSVAVVGVFSPSNTEQELRVAEIASEVLGVPVSCSHAVGTIGLLERENATVLNAALQRTLGEMVRGFIRALEQRGIEATPFLGQNDGTLMRLEYALEFPVFTIGCGPTNSIRGAAHLSGLANALVVDIGGTTTDIGVLIDGFPRQSAHAVEIGGIRTNFRMPDVLSVGLGGGTIVRERGVDGTGQLTVGPDSVGYRLTSEAFAFGGDTLTATDIALALGTAEIEGTRQVTLEPELVSKADQAIRALLEESIDRMKPNANPVPVVLVGGGGVIAPDSLDGVSELIRPDHFGAANAVGAALGEVAGYFEKIYQNVSDRAEARRGAGLEAVERAVAAGAQRETVEVVSVEEIPVAYTDGQAVQIKARAVGKLGH
ncbi:MAG: hydantoinase/oxoprolinase family protein [Actinobacteria bacterium]|nr:hydantoinase/oxoprolinase family protein [Actinomycetota bacterium]